MTDTPERIALDWTPGAAVTDGPLFETRTRWVREDVHLAEVAAAYEAAARQAWLQSGPTLCKAIRALTPADARAALDKMLDAEREACAQVADACQRQNGPMSEKGFTDHYRKGLEAAGEAIAAAIRARNEKTPGA